MVSEPGSSELGSSFRIYITRLVSSLIQTIEDLSSWFSLFKKNVFEAMVVSRGRSPSLMSIKGVAQLWSKLKPFKKKAFPLFLKLVTWGCEERWSLLSCCFKKEVMNKRRGYWVTIQLSYPPESCPVIKEAQGTSSGSLVNSQSLIILSDERNVEDEGGFSSLPSPVSSPLGQAHSVLSSPPQLAVVCHTKRTLNPISLLSKSTFQSKKIEPGCFRQNIIGVTIYASLGEDALIYSLNVVGV
uniref:Uncharacterized protein n=1 Tax=Brassica oleracea var. oleracea TaxID=109376 RepID=A0A0D3D838_BRAOL